MNYIKDTRTRRILEYVWVDLEGNLRSKIKVDYVSNFKEAANYSVWNFDGSSTGQAPDNNSSDVIIAPVRIYDNPLIDHPNAKILLCECLTADLMPHVTNTRDKCQKTSFKYKEFECLFGIEQEYTILHRDAKPYKWLNSYEPGIGDQGPYYCSVGGDRAFGREIADEHLLACLKAGVHICGTNAEVMPSQWEFQIGTCDMLTVSDDLLVARFLLHKISEKYNCAISFYPKLFKTWNGSGGHTNFSTKQMRDENGLEHIIDACKKLAKKHKEHIEVYGKDNDRRLTGKHETSSIETFSCGKCDRSCSVRIPLQVCNDKCGYLEDRRPAANMDPYLVTEIMVRTICSEE